VISPKEASPAAVERAHPGPAPDHRPLRGLFLMFEGIGSTIFDSQVALHASAMPSVGVTFEIWSFEGFRSRYPRSRARLAAAADLSGAPVRLFRGVCVHYPLSDPLNALLVLFHWLRLRPKVDFVHARADWPAAACGMVARFLGVPVLWDCRGDAAAEFLDSYRPRSPLARLAKRLYIPVIRRRARFAARTCAGANFVSEPLRERLGRGTEGKPVTVIPCPVSSALFSFSPDLRRTMRERLGYAGTDLVVIYSGGMVRYQGFPECVALFRRLHGQDGRCRFLVVSPDIDARSPLLAELPPGSWQLRSAGIREMNGFYNAADFGMLLRKDDAVNQVASPTKFGEYCMTGLPVVMNDSVRQAVALARRFGNYRPVDVPRVDLRPLPETERSAVADRAAAALSREVLSGRYRSLYEALCGPGAARPAGTAG
jgi:hypothetical protein